MSSVSATPVQTPSAASTIDGTVTPVTTADSSSQVGMSASNGDHADGDSESSKTASGSDPTYHALSLTSYVFNLGYLNSQWTDVQFTFFDTGANLHRLIVSRSPYLAQLMAPHPPGAILNLTFNDHNIIPQSVHIALQHFYNPAQHLVDNTNARAILATAYLFEGMPELLLHAYTALRDSLNHDNVLENVEWISEGQGDQAGTWVQDAGGRGRYGEWSSRLKQNLTEYIIRTLPSSILETTPASSLSTSPLLLAIYTHLPYPLFKLAVESPDLPLPDTQARFAFAKRCIAHRKKIGVTLPGLEEGVVLAVGGEGGEVNIIRKPKRGARAPLWKVEG